jgi:hypothetical protein
MRLAPVLAVAFLAALARAADAPDGLELDLALLTKGPVQPGERIAFEVKLVNTSKSVTHKVVPAAEGSQHGWREPHVFWTATFVGKDGAERPAAAAPASGDGALFVPDWWKDVRDLEPGASLAIGSMSPPWQVFDVQEDGTLRLVAHYKWNLGRETRGDPLSGGASAPADLGGMKGVAAYDIASKPADIEVRRWFEVIAKMTGTFKAGIAAPLSSVVDVSVHSLSACVRRFDPAEWNVAVVVDPKSETEPELTDVAPKKGAPAFELVDGATTPLLRGSPLGAGRDVTLRFDAAGKARIAVTFERSTPKDGVGPRLRSNWIEVDVAK